MTDLDGVFRREWGPSVALRSWPRDGLPDRPGGWLITVARNRARDRLRRDSIRPGKELAAFVDDSHAGSPEPHPVRDDELQMLFTCAHPALDRRSQLALALRLVSGLTVAEIARALLQTQAAIGQRITRAVQDSAREDPAAGAARRIAARAHTARAELHLLGVHRGVLVDGGSAIRDELCDEGVRLAGELCDLMPHPEAHALAALVLLHDARRPAEALIWYRKALELNTSEPGRNFLRRRISECGG